MKNSKLETLASCSFGPFDIGQQLSAVGGNTVATTIVRTLSPPPLIVDFIQDVRAD